VELSSIDERVRQLCAKAATAQGQEAEQILAELREALREHARFVRLMSARTLTRVQEKHPSFRNDD
jgi:hypothetical protein